jgi:hypothetical protein
MRTGSRAFVDNDVCTTYCRLSFCRPGAMRLGEEFRVFGFSAPNPHLIEFSDVPERLEMGLCLDAAPENRQNATVGRCQTISHRGRDSGCAHFCDEPAVHHSDRLPCFRPE